MIILSWSSNHTHLYFRANFCKLLQYKPRWSSYLFVICSSFQFDLIIRMQIFISFSVQDEQSCAIDWSWIGFINVFVKVGPSWRFAFLWLAHLGAPCPPHLSCHWKVHGSGNTNRNSYHHLFRVSVECTIAEGNEDPGHQILYVR